jgi:hypothetical protein
MPLTDVRRHLTYKNFIEMAPTPASKLCALPHEGELQHVGIVSDARAAEDTAAASSTSLTHSLTLRSPARPYAQYNQQETDTWLTQRLIPNTEKPHLPSKQ